MQYYFDSVLDANQVRALIEDKCNDNDNYDVVKIESFVLPAYPYAVFWVLLSKPDFHDPYEDSTFNPHATFGTVPEAHGFTEDDGPPF